VSEEARKQIVQELLKKYTGPVEEFAIVKAALLKMSLEELQQYAQLKSAAIKATEADDRLLELQAARAADRILHRLHLDKARQPQREAEERRQLAFDKDTFEQACRQFRIGNTEASFGLIRDALGPGFTTCQVGQALHSGSIRVSPATPEEIQEWTREAQEQRQQYLRNAEPEELRRIVRSEAESRRIEAQRKDQERQIAHREALDAQMGFPSLPEVNERGEKIDAAYLVRISNTNLALFKRFIKSFGAANVTARLRGIR
jgi:hypothetical protein